MQDLVEIEYISTKEPGTRGCDIVESGAVDLSLMMRFVNYIDAGEKTISTYKRALKQFFSYLSENNITHPQRQHVLDYKTHLLETCKATTVQSYITAVRLFFKWCAQENLYPNITDHIKGVKISKEHKKDYLSANQVVQIISSIDQSSTKGARDYAIFYLMVTCGLRDIEVSRANIEDLRTLGNNTVLFVHGKGRSDKSEYIKVTKPVEAAIRAYLKERAAADDKEPLFISNSNNSQGKRLSTRSISKIIKSAMVKAGYNSERLTAHSLRHTAVTLSLLSGQSIEEVQQFARHSSIDTTNIYNHALDKAANSCSESVTNMILQNL